MGEKIIVYIVLIIPILIIVPVFCILIFFDKEGLLLSVMDGIEEALRSVNN